MRFAAWHGASISLTRSSDAATSFGRRMAKQSQNLAEKARRLVDPGAALDPAPKPGADPADRPARDWRERLAAPETGFVYKDDARNPMFLDLDSLPLVQAFSKSLPMMKQPRLLRRGAAGTGRCRRHRGRERLRLRVRPGVALRLRGRDRVVTLPDPLVELKGVVKAFGGFEAIRAVTLSLHRGEVVALLGHNGAGKTVLVRMLATLAWAHQWLGVDRGARYATLPRRDSSAHRHLPRRPAAVVRPYRVSDATARRRCLRGRLGLGPAAHRRSSRLSRLPAAGRHPGRPVLAWG